MKLYERLGIKKELLDDLIDIFTNFKSIEKAVIFGSRANGTYRQASDIDIALYSTNISSKELNIIIDAVNNLNTALEFDIINYYNLTKEKLIINIDNEGVIIYERS